MQELIGFSGSLHSVLLIREVWCYFVWRYYGAWSFLDDFITFNVSLLTYEIDPNYGLISEMLCFV